MPVEPKPAATCIIYSPDGEILMGRRNESLRFMPGHHVFPGGRVDDDETANHMIGINDSTDVPRVKASAREAFEETGLMLAEGTLPTAEQLRDARIGLLENSVSFDEILTEFNLVVNAALFEPAGAWVTPPASPIRFDTRYFLHRHDRTQEEELIVGELTGLDWMSPQEARRRWHLGEIKLSTPVAYTLHQMSSSSYPEFLDLLGRPINRTGSTRNRYELRRGVHSIPLATATIPPATTTNCLIVGEEEVLVFDPGSDEPEELSHLKSQLDHLLELGSSIHAIVLTHSHRDHTGGVKYLQEHYGAPLWAHEKTDEQIDLTVDRHIADDEVITLLGDPGWQLRALHTPGHDPGHLSFYEETTRIMICGDMIANPGTIVVSEAYGGNMDEFLASLERLKTFEEAELLVPAHGAADSNSVAKLQEHIDHRLWREAKIKDAYEGGATTLADLLAKAYDDVPEASLPLAEHAMKSHLARLGIELSG